MGLTVITPYWNPLRLASRRANFARFREAMQGANLLIAECGDELEGDIIRCQSPSILWHKERLINLALERVETDAVAWIDADAVFSAPDWEARILRALERWPVVQCFTRQVARYSDGSRITPGCMVAAHCGVERMAPAPGGAWAMRRGTLKLFENALVGGADTILARALQRNITESDAPVEELAHTFMAGSEALMAEIMRYAATITMKAGYVQQELTLLEHGSRMNRRHRARHAALAGYETGDVITNETGALQWATDKPEMHAAVVAFFQQRNEDERAAILDGMV